MASTSPPWRVVVEFLDVDLDDDAVVDALVCGQDRQIAWSSSDGVTTAEGTIYAETPDAAVSVVVTTTRVAAPDAVVLRLVDPLVTVSDIAEDARVTRQAVRNWATGTRQSGFPRPLAVVGDGVRVWRQADVDAWLIASLDLGTGHRFPTAAFIAEANEQLSYAGSDDPPDEGTWFVASQRSEQQNESVERPRRVPASPARPRKTAAR